MHCCICSTPTILHHTIRGCDALCETVPLLTDDLTWFQRLVRTSETSNNNLKREGNNSTKLGFFRLLTTSKEVMTAGLLCPWNVPEVRRGIESKLGRLEVGQVGVTLPLWEGAQEH